MPTTLAFKDTIDLPCWRPLAPLPANTAAGGCWAWDARNSVRNVPYNYFLASATSLLAYSAQNDEVIPLGSPGLAGTFGAGAAAVLHPTQGPRGVLAAGNTTTTVVLSTALPGAVAVNALANRGDGVGYTIRIIGNNAGGSGLIESRTIIANTGGTTPTITIDSPLTFTPGTGAGYEIRSGRVYMLGAGTVAAGTWKFYDIATGTFSGNLSTTNLPASIATDSALVALSEGYGPCVITTPGDGFFGDIVSAAGNTSTTINASAGVLPSSLVANEYRNFQVRITEDTAAPTAVGQRRRIASHTLGATAVFTLASAWTVTPSATAKFVVENDDDKILLFTAQTSVYTFNIGGNAWDTTTFAAAGAAGGAGIVAAQCSGIERDPTGNARHSFIYRVRGGNGAQVDVLDIAGGANGLWAADITYTNRATLFNTGTCGASDPITNGGKYLYLNVSGTQRFARFDMRNRILEPWTFLGFPQGAAVAGGKLAMAWFFDGTTKLGFLSASMNTSASTFSIALQR